jgi:carbohydrate kinase (thermoresistant glucokinase family)
MSDFDYDLPTAIIVMGVSGAGKSTVAGLLARRLAFEFRDGDSFHPPENVRKMTAGIPLTDDDRWPWLQAISTYIHSVHADGRHAVIACSALRRAYRSVLIGNSAIAIRLVYLKGPKELIARRVTSRHEHFMPPALLDSQFATLEEPNADERPLVVSIAKRPGRIVDDILSQLSQKEVEVPLNSNRSLDEQS